MFMERFAPLVASGAKRQTIRPIPKRMPKASDKESWRKWSGKAYRSPQIELAQVELTGVYPIEIFVSDHPPTKGVRIDGPIEANWDEFVKADGFDSIQDFFNFFEKQHGLPFKGILILAK